MIKTVIVEDDHMVAAINNQFAQKLPGIQVVATFHNGRDALAFLQQTEVDLLLLDLYMPGLSGLALLESLRAAGSRTDVILITAANDQEHLCRALRLGITDYLIKPFRYERFALAVNKVLTRRQLLAEGQAYTQADIDRLFLAAQPAPPRPVTLEKGMQQATLDRLCEALRAHPDEYCTAEQLAAETGFSKVTVRRYLNYLIENNEADSRVNYSTGGRPCVEYGLST